MSVNSERKTLTVADMGGRPGSANMSVSPERKTQKTNLAGHSGVDCLAVKLSEKARESEVGRLLLNSTDNLSQNRVRDS